MYTPPSFRVEDLPTIHAFMQAHSFATLVTGGESLIATHLPVTLKAEVGEWGTIHAHMARANSQWKLLEGREVLMIFQGAHTYISPTWYEVHPSVPTWNYTAVHAYGTVRLVHEPSAVEAMLHTLVHQYEDSRTPSWEMDLPTDYMHKQIAAVVAFEMTITRLEAKFKLSQNRSETDQANVVAHLSRSTHPDDLATARVMKEVNSH
jgi:transcriptional regulator